MFRFKSSNIYLKTKSWYNKVRPVVKRVKADFTLKDQLNRPGLSVLLNVVEGLGRFTPKDQRHFMIMSRSSLYETVILFDILRDDDYLSQKEYQELIKDSEELSRILFVMIKNYESKTKVN